MTCKFTDINTNSRKFWRQEQILINFFYELWQVTKPSCYYSRTTIVLTAIQSNTIYAKLFLYKSYMFDRNSGLGPNCDLFAFVVLSCHWGRTCDGFELVPFIFFYYLLCLKALVLFLYLNSKNSHGATCLENLHLSAVSFCAQLRFHS